MKINEKFCCSVDFPRKTSIKVDSEVNQAWIDIASSDRRKRTVIDDEHGSYHSLTRLTRQKAQLL